jgi:hypothetical protein
VSYIDTGVTIKSLAVQDLSEGEHGILEVAGNDADNDEGSITTGGNVGTIGLISDTAAQAKRLAFECRIKKASVDDNACAFFVGLSEEGLSATFAAGSNGQFSGSWKAASRVSGHRSQVGRLAVIGHLVLLAFTAAQAISWSRFA